MIHLTMLNLDSREIVQNVFSPMVGVISSPLADEICQKNHLSFVEMLQPFTRLSTDAYFHDPTGATNSIKGTRINVCDIGWQPPHTNIARKQLTDAVATAQCEAVRNVSLDDGTVLHVPQRQLWFEQWRETFLSVQTHGEHEFTRHLLSCLIVLSSSDPTPLDTAQQITRQLLATQTQTPPPKLPKWFGGVATAAAECLNCYVLLHDASQDADITRAQQSYESLKLTFGEHRCFLIQINSQSPPNDSCTDLWSKYLRRQLQPTASTGEQSAPRTPQDASLANMTTFGGAMMASTPHGTPPTSIQINEEVVDHPLSPVQENATEAIHSNMSTSCESLGQQNQQSHLNPNVWADTNATRMDSNHEARGQYLNASDLDNLKHFVQDYTIRSLIPYVERLVVGLHDAVTNKKGRSLLSVTKRWFVTNKPVAAAAALASGAGASGGSTGPTNAVVYTADASELQTRKLGDLYFMFGNYKQAFEHYHQAKRDFSADSAWQFYAGALEMAALSAFMSGTATRKTYDYMEEAIVTYLNHCRQPQFATRATLLSIECLRQARLHSEAAKQLIRMTSEDSDLRSALLLEQAAYVFLSAGVQPLHRKYAFHIVLAGHRYAKAGQRRHAFRCYKQAYEVFSDRGWSLAEDHIQYTIGKQAVTLKRMDEASAALAHLLRPSSLQSSVQQAAFLREYIATQKTYVQMQSGSSSSGGGGGYGGAAMLPLLDVPLPKIVLKATRVLVAAHPPVAVPGLTAAMNIRIDSNLQDEWKWQKLEEIVVQVASKKPIMIFKSTRALFTSEMPTIESPLGVHGEPIDVSFTLENTIKPPITFEDVHLLWTFHADASDGSATVISNAPLFGANGGLEAAPAAQRAAIEQCVTATHIRSVHLNEFDRQTLCIRLIPLQTGRLTVDGVVGRLSLTNEPSTLWGRLNFDPVPIVGNDSATSGPGVSAAAAQAVGAQQQQQQQFDKKLQIDVLPAVPSLQVQFSAVPDEVLAGEIVAVQVTLSNAGAVGLGDVWAATEHPRWVLGEERELPLSVLKDFKDLTNEALIRDKEARRQHTFCLLRTLPGCAYAIGPNETRTTTIYIQAPLRKGSTDIKLLIHYAIPDGDNAAVSRIRYRLVRHAWQLNVNESLALSVCANIGNMRTAELGVDVQVSNLNQVHHPLMTEIVPLALHLFCGRYEFGASGPVFLHGPGVRQLRSNTEQLHEIVGLNTMESFAMRMVLSERKQKDSASVETDAVAFVRDCLSQIQLSDDVSASAVGSESTETTAAAAAVPTFKQLDSFLMKNETKYIGQLGQTGNNEVFNQIVTQMDRHMTFAFTWRATVNDNMSQQRTALGQHFVQLRNLYETISWPPRDKVMQPFAGHEELYDLYDYKASLNVAPWTDDPDDWDDNDVSVARRCFLEVDDEKPTTSMSTIDDLTQQTAAMSVAVK